MYSIRKSYVNEEANYISFDVPRKYRKNEEDFWRKNMTQIMASKGVGPISLSEFLKKANMTESEFHTWRKFLKEYNFIYINKDKENKLITIGLTPKTGYIYKVDSNVDLGYSDERVVKLNENWFYFDERAKEE